jgi:hypothetical protein
VPDSPATPPTSPTEAEPRGLPAPYVGLVDDAAIFPPGNSPLDAAVAAWHERRDEPWSALVASFVVSDTRLPELADAIEAAGISEDRPLPVSVVVAAGAGAIAPAASTARRMTGARLTGVEVALRDPEDLFANARRIVTAVDQARDHGAVDDDVTVHVELPQGPTTHGWLAAADEVAAAELRLKYRTGGMEADLFPTVDELASWIDAALDRETPFKCTAGLHHAVRHTDPETGFSHHGFLTVLAATRAALDGGDVRAVLDERDGTALVAALPDDDTLTRTRRWFTSFGSCSVREPLDDLVHLGLVDRLDHRPAEEA